jgi:hypothetical protein
VENEIVYDIEANGFVFESTKVWTVVLKQIQTGKTLKVNPFKDSKAKEKIVEFIFSFGDSPRLIGHFILGYDAFVLQNLLGLTFTVGKDTLEGRPVQFVDTLYLSMFLNPDRQGHSVGAFGEILGLPKIDWRQEAIDLGIIPKDAPKGAEFMQYHENLDVYCERDTDVNVMLYEYLKKEWQEVYGKPFSITDAYKCGQKSFYLMSCQELTGFKFDVEGGLKLKERIGIMMEEIRAEVEPKLPPRALKKSEEKYYSMPAKPWKKSGEFSSSWEKFVEKHNGALDTNTGLWEFYGEKYPVVAGAMLNIKLPMEMANQDQMKDWFLENNWKPTLWNLQRGPDGKPMRDPKTRQLIQTSPKIQEQGKICPNLMKLEGDIVKLVVKWLSLRNRQSVLEGWLTNDRLQMDGRIGAGRTGIASTHRQKHRTVVNVPKASEKVLLGKEFRSLWISEDGMLIAAGDAAALEGRVQGHYCFKYDDGATAEELLKGDVHSKNARFAFYDHIPDVQKFDIDAKDFSKDHPVFKPYRDTSKNGYYACMYGCAGPKLASTLGLPVKMGNDKLEAFWEANPATKALKENLEKYWTSTGREKYLPAIDGRMLCTRKKSALLNTIFQSCGGISMDYALCFMDAWLGGLKWKDRKPYYLYKGHLVRRIGYWHDEAEFECDAAIAEEIGQMIEKAIEKAGQYLKLKVPLAGEAKTGKSWMETH